MTAVQEPTTAGVAMPPRRGRGERVQLNARVRVEVEQTLQRFVRAHGTTVQDCVDLALAEFLAARGYRAGDYRPGDYRAGDYRAGDYRAGEEVAQ